MESENKMLEQAAEDTSVVKVEEDNQDNGSSDDKTDDQTDDKTE